MKKRVPGLPSRPTHLMRPRATRRSFCDIHRETKVVRQRVSRAHGQNRKRGAGVCQHLDQVMNGAVTAAGEDGVAAF
jgi:hypothetical protein